MTPTYPRHVSRRRLKAAFLCLSVFAGLAAPAAMAAGSTGTWQGSYRSRALDRDVDVVLELSATGGELRFVTLDCKVGLQPAGPADAAGAAYAIVPTKDAAGAYCGGWLGGRVQTQRAGDGGNLKTVVSRGQSQITLQLAPAP